MLTHYYYRLESLIEYKNEKARLYIVLDTRNRRVFTVKITPENLMSKIKVVSIELPLKLCPEEIIEQIITSLKKLEHEIFKNKTLNDDWIQLLFSYVNKCIEKMLSEIKKLHDEVITAIDEYEKSVKEMIKKVRISTAIISLLLLLISSKYRYKYHYKA